METISAKDLNKYRDKNISALIQIATPYFNRFIRERDREGNWFYCPTCDKRKKIDNGNYHACHLFPAGHYSWLRFNEDNVHGGCQSCNYFKHGAGYTFVPYVIKKIGQERFDKLVELNAYHKQHGFKWDRLELIEIIIKYKNKNGKITQKSTDA